MQDHRRDIERYIKGELSPSEMHALEKRALQDPFLAEALEGAQQAGGEQFALDLNVIHQSIREKTGKKKSKRRFLFTNNYSLYMGVAAGLILLTVTYYIIASIIRERQRPDLQASKAPAMVKDSVKSENKQGDSLLALNQQPLEEPSGEAQKPKKETKTSPSQRKAPVDQRMDQSIPPAAIPPAEAEQQSSGAMSEAEMIAEEKDDVSENAIANADRQKEIRDTKAKKSEAPEGVASEARREAALSAPLQSLVTGNVRLEDGEALPGVVVTVKGTTTGTVTDGQGNFAIHVPDSKQPLVFQFIGLETKELIPGQRQQLDVVLQSDVTALSEVVVTGRSTAKKDEDADVITAYAEPVDGRKAFRQYLQKNMQYPQAAIDQKIEGRSTVEFSVSSDGTLSDFRILKRVGGGCDEELIRLIQSGPKWTPTQKNDVAVDDRVRVKFRFTLPSK